MIKGCSYSLHHQLATRNSLPSSFRSPRYSPFVPVPKFLNEADVLQIRHALLHEGPGVVDGLVVGAGRDLLQAVLEEEGGLQFTDIVPKVLAHVALDGGQQFLLHVLG